MKNTWNCINTLSINDKKKKKIHLLFLRYSPGTRLRTGGGIRYSTQFFAFFPQCGSWSQTTSLKRVNDNSITNDPLEISNISNNYSSSVGEKLVLRVPPSSCSFTEYLWLNNNPNSFFFDPVFPMDIEREILCMSIPINKTYGLLPCPINILSGAKHIISGPLSNIINISVQEFEGVFPPKLRQGKVISA